MGRQTKLRLKERTIKGKLFFQVTIPKVGGGREQRTFKDRREAKTFFQLKEIELRNRGTAGIGLSDQIRGDALSAMDILKPYNGVNLIDAARFYANHHEKIAASETVENVVNAFLTAKEPDSRRRYFTDLRYRLERFKLSFGTRKLADIDAGELQDWVNQIPNLKTGGKLEPRSRNSYLRRLSVLWTYGIDRGWCAANPISRLKMVKSRDDEEVGILTPEETRRLLEHADKRSLPYWCIGAFCGLRAVELQQLEWSSVHWDEGEIEVKSWTSKTATKRFIPMRDPLPAWLKPYHNETGRIYPRRKALEADRARAGLLEKWPENGLRHSFASYSLAHFKDSRALSLDLGHTDPQLVFRHYHQLVRPAAALKYWSIFPK